MESALTDFHFLRPAWLLALLAVLPLWWWQRRQRAAASGWQRHIAPALLPLLLRGSSGGNRRWPLLIGLLCGAIIGAAGPTWQKLPQPVEQNQSALVAILDLSPSLYAQDIAPSRLVRARFKLLDLLNQRGDGLTALVVYAGEAHVLSPLTEDSNTIAHLVPVLSPSLLVEIGSNLEDAIEQAVTLIDNGAEQRGDIILITDGATATAAARSSALLANHSAVRLSILGVGSAAGAPIPLAAGGFVKAADGAIVLPKLNRALLADLAARHRGIYRDISVDDSDIEALLAHSEQRAVTASQLVERDYDQWRDRAHWVALLLLLPLMLAFRRGVLMVALLLTLPLTHSPTATAEDGADQLATTPQSVPLTAQLSQGWRDLWWRRDQQAAAKLAAGDPTAAAQLFERSDWAGTAAYRAGDYASAVEQFYADDPLPATADTLYNRATALARAGELKASLAAYDQLLERQPGHVDGRYNRDIVERALQQQEQQQQQQDQQDQQDQQQDGHDQNQQSQGQDQAGDNQANQQPPDPAGDSQQQQQQQRQQSDQPAEPQSGQNPEQETEQETEQQTEQEQQQPPEPTPGEGSGEPDGDRQDEQPAAPLSAEQAEQQAADRELEQWLRKIDDDPAGLLRAKFRYQSQQRAREQKLRPPPGSDDSERW